LLFSANHKSTLKKWDSTNDDSLTKKVFFIYILNYFPSLVVFPYKEGEMYERNEAQRSQRCRLF